MWHRKKPPVDYPASDGGYTGQAAIVFNSILIYYGHNAYKSAMRKAIHEFLNFAVQHHLWKQGVSRKNQDWTRMVGIYTSFFHQHGIDCGVLDQEIRNAYVLLAYKMITE